MLTVFVVKEHMAHKHTEITSLFSEGVK